MQWDVLGEQRCCRYPSSPVSDKKSHTLRGASPIPVRVERVLGEPITDAVITVCRHLHRTLPNRPPCCPALLALGHTLFTFLPAQCPAYFNDSQRTATRDAGTLAGLNVCEKGGGGKEEEERKTPVRGVSRSSF